jgi:hypothetical protein
MKKNIKDILIKLGYNRKPDFIVLGAQKAGTTALYQILKQHSLIKGSNTKEIHYFNNDLWYSENKITSYHSFFPWPHNVPKKAKLFEITPCYLFHPEVAKRLYNYNPNLKLIIIMRNPAARAFSAWTMYHHHFKTGWYREQHDPRTFTEAINEELKNLEHTSYSEDKRGYIKRGIYHYQIEAFLKYFPKNQLIFIESNELKEKKETLAQIQSFIDVPFENITLLQTNQSQVCEKNNFEKDLLKLKEFYLPYNKKLYKLIGREFNWDDEILLQTKK